MTTQIATRRGPVTKRDLQQLEEVIGQSLPEDYREFLAEYNGGVPTPSVFDFDQAGFQNSSTVRHFFAATGTDPQSLQGILKVYSGRVPDALLPIAADETGNLICIGLAGEVFGRVYFWDHELESEEGEEPGFQNAYPLAPSFDGFLGILRESEVTEWRKDNVAKWRIEGHRVIHNEEPELEFSFTPRGDGGHVVGSVTEGQVPDYEELRAEAIEFWENQHEQ